MGGSTPSKQDPTFWENGDIPWVSPKDMKTFEIRGSEDKVTQKALARLSLVPEGSVLVVVRSGILSHSLPVAQNHLPVTINQDMRAFVPAKGIDSRYLALQLTANSRAILNTCAKDGTTVASIEGGALASFPLVIAPHTEQTRIVEKLEELLGDLDAGVAELKAAQKKLTQYRQSLLKAAVEGALTADWRARNPPRETGADLLARILQERRARWEAQQLARFEAQGKTPPKNWQARYPEPVAPDTTELPALPPRWIWASAEQLCEFITKGTTPRKETASATRSIPFIRVTNLTEQGVLDFSDQVFVTEETHHGFLSRSVVYPDDVLMNIVGPPLGQVSLVPETFAEWNINQAIAIFRAVAGVLPEYICHYLLSPNAQSWLGARAKTTAGQTNLTLELCRQLPVPLPPTEEQHQLVESANQLLLSTRDAIRAIESVNRQSTAQRQNLLKAAFSGQLVSQHPTDEPASTLLARIRAERAAQVVPNKVQGRKKKVSS